jgi:immune inhibitor A
MNEPIQVLPNLYAAIYLTVPADCKIGVCAHELGHLAFQWQDFYDPNYDRDGREWDGTGRWGTDGRRIVQRRRGAPSAPSRAAQGSAYMGRGANGAADFRDGLGSAPPYSATDGKVVRVESTKYRQRQYLILENRRKVAFAFDLPSEGLLVWRVDESGEQEAPDAPGLYLI